MFALPTTDFDCGRTCKAGHWCRFTPLLRAAGVVTRVHSHVAKVDTVITDLDALEAAAAKCGLVLKRGQQTYRWYGQSVGDWPLPPGMRAEDLGKCSHAVGVADWTKKGRYDTEPYEIGLVARQDGRGYDLVWDFWNGGYGLQEKAGAGCKKLIEAYHVAAVETAAQNLGWLSERTAQGLTVYHPEGGSLSLSGDGTVETSGFVGDGCHRMREQLGIAVQDGSIVQKAEAALSVATVSLRG